MVHQKTGSRWVPNVNEVNIKKHEMYMAKRAKNGWVCGASRWVREAFQIQT